MQALLLTFKRVYWRLLALICSLRAAEAELWPRPIGPSLAFGRPFASLLLNPHDARAHLDLVTDTRIEVAHDARVGGDQRVLHLHRLDHREALARSNNVAVFDRNGDKPTVHRRADRRIALFHPGLGLREGVDELDERLPPARESIHAAIGLVERDRVAVLGALVLL